MGSKPPAAVGERISKGERRDLGAAAPLPTRASSLEQGRAGSPMESSPKLVELFGSGSTRLPCYIYEYFRLQASIDASVSPLMLR